MPPAIIGGALAGLGGLGASIIGANASSDAADKAAGISAAAAKRFLDTPLPDYDAMRLQLEQLKLQGVITPEQEVAIMQDPSLMQGVTQNQNILDTELGGLGRLEDIVNSKGLDSQAQLNNEQARQQASSTARGARDANLMNAAQRGASGSGLEFVSNQLADQAGADRLYSGGLQEAAASNQREMQALDMLANQSGNLQNRQLALDTAKAQSADAINKFNTQLRADTQSRNVGANNSAQASNLAARQNISDQNTTMRNAQQQYNKSLEDKRFQDQMDVNRGAAGLAASNAAATQASGQAAANIWGGLGQGLIGAGTAFAGYGLDPNKKLKPGS